MEPSYLPSYAALSRAEQNEILAFLQQRHGWDEQTAQRELMNMEPRFFAELKWDMRDAAKQGRSEYHPHASMYRNRTGG